MNTQVLKCSTCWSPLYWCSVIKWVLWESRVDCLKIQLFSENWLHKSNLFMLHIYRVLLTIFPLKKPILTSTDISTIKTCLQFLHNLPSTGWYLHHLWTLPAPSSWRKLSYDIWKVGLQGNLVAKYPMNFGCQSFLSDSVWMALLDKLLQTRKNTNWSTKAVCFLIIKRN